jgi:hypothetical protein
MPAGSRIPPRPIKPQVSIHILLSSCPSIIALTFRLYLSILINPMTSLQPAVIYPTPQPSFIQHHSRTPPTHGTSQQHLSTIQAWTPHQIYSVSQQPLSLLPADSRIIILSSPWPKRHWLQRLSSGDVPPSLGARSLGDACGAATLAMHGGAPGRPPHAQRRRPPRRPAHARRRRRSSSPVTAP